MSEKVHSQPITIPYSCGFEDPVENQEWVLNYGPEGPGCKDKWMIGNGARSEGLSGLYISADSTTAMYGWGYANTVVAYRTFSVPEQIPYDISFDWMNSGVPGTSDLYVLLLSDTDTPLPSDSTSSYMLTGGASDIVFQRMISSAFNNNSQWSNFDIQRTLRANRNYTLMFVWSNHCRDSLANPLGACIDNIQITSTWCPKPYDFNLSASCDTTVLTWQGTSTYYEAEYKQRGSGNQWRKLGVQSATEINIVNLPEGMYDFRVRGVCGKDTSAFKTVNSVVVYCPDQHCINFVALTDPKVVTAYHGTADNPTRYQGIVDYGSQNILSQHTVNWTQDEFDPRTNNQLRTIPQGSFASVRLGNWKAGAGAEVLDYIFTVDSSQSILLLQYAIVLEDPDHKPKTEQPHFLLEVRDENGKPIDPTCGVAEFYADKSMKGWKMGKDGATWKDWTTVGLNLDDYIGQTLTIRLLTADCKPSAHYGYAYFTLDCASAAIAANTCGDAAKMVLSAPEGFTYRWYNPNYPNQEWYTREIDVPSTDTTTYYCEVCFVEESSCCFTLFTQIFPRFPIADFSYEYAAENCQNIIRFKNKSHIMTKYDGNEVHTNEFCDVHIWDFGNGQTSPVFEPVITCSNDGETLHVRLTAYLADCYKDTIIPVTVPAIGETVDTMYHEMCYGQSIIFGNQLLFGQGIYYDTIPSRITGCDSITILELTVHPQYDDPVVFDTICFGEVREFAGRQFSETKRHDVWEKSIYGCDSVVTLDLYVRDEITFDLEVTDVLQGPYSGKIEIKDVSITDYSYTVNGEWNGALTGLSGGIYTIILYNEFGCASEQIQVIVFQDCLEVVLSEVPVICGDDDFFEINYSINKGFATTYDVLFSDEAKAAGFSDLISVPADGQPVHIVVPMKIRPDNYWMDIRFEDLLCDSVVNILPFTVYYPQSILEQKWNDVIAILNYDNNDGYDFTAFQWYKNGSPLFGKNHSYLYIENDELDFDAEYSVLLTRSDDGKSILTCPIFPAYRNSEISLYPLIVYKQERVNLSVSADASVTIYDSLGRKQRAFSVASGNSIQLNVSDQTGYYIVIVQLDNGMQESFKVLVR